MKKELWLRLKGYDFGHVVPAQLGDRVRGMFGTSDASLHAFASKIARKHHWSHRFTVRAINEYKKFVFLGITSDAPVTPSRVIDTVWHEHLLFSRAYRDFCRTVLEREFDHNPELLPMDEQTTAFQSQFDATCDAYEREFNRLPPADIWGTPKFKRERHPAAFVDSGTVLSADYVPLYMMFSDGDASAVDFADFGGGGGFSGGGGESSWGSDAGSDSTTTDSGSSGSSDGGSSCGSSCSSSCGSSGCSS